MIVVSAEKNPAAPFYFVLTPTSGAYTFNGEGSGDKAASDAAGDALARLSPRQLADLLAATVSVHAP